MKKISHSSFGECWEITVPNDLAFCRVAQRALVNDTILPSGTKTPAENLWIRGRYLVQKEHRPEGSFEPDDGRGPGPTGSMC
jgi:hypothetical protein